MKKDSRFLSRLLLVLGDLFAIAFSFFFAYYFRTHLDERPYYFESDISGFIFEIILVIPIWIIVLGSLGLYSKSILARQSRSKEIARVFIASIIGMMSIVTIDFFGSGDLFPVRTVAIYSFVLCFFFLLLNRIIFRFIRNVRFRHNRGTLRAVVIGNNKNTDYLTDYISSNPESGY